MSKYGNVRTERDGYTFASKREAADYTDLTIMQSIGEIMDLKCQPNFILQDKFTDASGVKHRAIVYVADFSYIRCDTGRLVVVESKGHETEVWKIKKKLFLHKYPDIELQVWRAI